MNNTLWKSAIYFVLFEFTFWIISIEELRKYNQTTQIIHILWFILYALISIILFKKFIEHTVKALKWKKKY